LKRIGKTSATAFTSENFSTISSASSILPVAVYSNRSSGPLPSDVIVPPVPITATFGLLVI
jgi:hypothetical protein